ncbi:T9SS type B sorting domain-containing protein [Flavobacteriaceae bacterium GF1]
MDSPSSGEATNPITSKAEKENLGATMLLQPMFTTIIQGADEQVGCSNNGFTVARFNLCGDSDDRTITLAGGPYGSVEWQLLGGSCSPDINEDCPNTNISCYTTVGTSQSFNLDASTVPAGPGAEFRVVADGQQFFFKVKKSTITQTFVKRDYICGVDGRIQITNLSSAYEFSIDGGINWQTSPIFDGLTPNTYNIIARLQNTPNTCEYPYDPIVIEQLDISIDVQFVDALCFGDTGSIEVTVNDVPGPYKYTLLDENGVPQEFTTFISANPYTFAAVGFGTYSVQVETQQCTGDIANGIPPPQQSLDINGNPIIIGDGVVALSASTEVNESLSTEPACNPPGGVDIILRTSGGTSPYTYTVNGAPGGTFSPPQTTHNVTTAGTYDFVITDANGCDITASADVEELTPPIVTASGVDGTCTNGGASLIFTVVDGKGYDLSFRATPADAWSTAPIISVSAGTYGGSNPSGSMEVLYEQGSFSCILALTTDIVVTETGAINGADPTFTDLSCNGSGGVDNGTIEFPGTYSGAGGGPYEFSINGTDFSSQQLFSNLPAGTYTPAVRNASGCRRDFTAITIADVDPPTDITFVQSNTNCAANTSDVQLIPTANASIDRYEIISPITVDNNTNDTFVGLTNNVNHVFRITDSNGCTYEESFTPAVISSIRARVKSGGDLRVCTNASDGNGTFIIDGFANNYTFNIDGGVESGPQNDREVDINSLNAGNYTITVTDVDTGCQDTATLTVEEPASQIDIIGNITPMSCANSNIGRVQANASGGFGGYTYTLEYPSGFISGPKTGRTFGNLTEPSTPANPYILTVEDSEGCTDTFEFQLTPVDAPVLGYDATASDLCYVPGTGATLGVQVTTDGTAGAPYEYRINGGSWGPSPVFSGLSPGNHIIEVRDGNNCTDNVSLTVNPQLRVTASLNTEIPCGGAPGSIDVSVTGGYTSGPGSKQYEVSADNGITFSAPSPLTSNNFTYPTTVAGTYIFRVTDNEGCVAESSPFVLDPPVNIAPALVDVFPPACGETNSGRAVIIPDATSGVAPYEISFDGGPFTSQTIYSGLNQGQTYTYVVRDARGCETVIDDFTVPAPGTAPATTVVPNLATCTTGNIEGSIDITNVTGGTPDFTYILQDQFGVEISRIGPTSSTTETFTGLAPDVYRIITLDANGCSDEDVVTVVQTTLDVVPDPVPAPTCAPGGFTNTVEIVGGDGSSGFEIRLVTDPPSAFVPVNIPPRRHTFSGLQFGVSYTVEVLDVATGCVYEEIIDPVIGPTPLEVTATSTAGFCDASRNGQITYTIDGFASGDNLLVEIFDVDSGALLDTQNLPGVTTIPFSDTFETLPGNYQVVVTNLTDFCSDGALITIDQNLPAIFVLAEEPANCNADGQFTVTGSGGAGGPYEFAFGPVGFTPDYDGTATPTDPSDDFSSTTTFTGPAGNYAIYVRDASGCTSFDIATIIQQQVPPVLNTPIVVNQCTFVPGNDFQITVSTPSTTDTPRFTLNGATQLGVLNGTGTLYEASFLVSTPGNYNVLLEDGDGCSSTGVAEVYEFLSASGEFSTEPSCNNSDGEITITTNGGSGDFDFDLSGTDYLGAPVSLPTQVNNATFTNMAPGTYQIVVTDNIVFDGSVFCSVTVNVVIEAATPPIISAIAESDISCNGEDDGSIDVILQAGTDIDSPLVYTLYESGTTTIVQQNSSGSFSNLVPDTYDVEVITARNCSTRQNGIVIDEPDSFAITASAPDFSCEPGINTYSSTIITVNVDPANPGTATGGYQFSITGFENYQLGSPGTTFEIIDDGSPQNITIYAIDGNGCPATFVLPTINPPTDVVPSLAVTHVLDCVDPETVRVSVVGSTDFTVNTNGPATVAPRTNTPGNNFVDIDLPISGDYLFEVVDNVGGCTYPLPVHHVDEPIIPDVVISEESPVRCSGELNGALNIWVTNYSGGYSYEVFEVDSGGTETSTGISGNLHTDDNPETISGLSGGSFRVRVTSTETPFCSSSSNLITVREPTPLVPSASPAGEVGCNNTGIIEASLSGGWEDTPATPYEYRLLYDTDNDGLSYETELYTWSTNPRFENLPGGNYQVQFRDSQGCPTTFDISLNSVDPIQAGIREPQGLLCPGANNAVLETFDPTTGDVFTATAGATGGVPGAGYKYQLIYYAETDASADPTTLTESSRSGLQDDPTFVGTGGVGYISQGWYAIEVTSSFGCVGITAPYFVDPPPAVVPNLVQVQAPGCGGLGQMRLSVTNPEAGFEYEFRPLATIPNHPISGPISDISFTRFEDDLGNPTTSMILEGTDGFYQFEVRKITVSNQCSEVNSNGLNLIDAQDLDLVVNQPDDISCANELDGRIESFSSGGVGLNTYTLYLGDPVDAFSPSPSAMVVQSNDFGTFEGLDAATDYFIAVTSGVSCQDIEGPFTVSRPEPIVFNATATPITCNGESDGTITVEVVSGGLGLVQFAISPNFNEFFSDPANPGVFTFEDLTGDASGREYTILIQDSEGCSETAIVEVFEPDELQVTGTSTPEICLGFADGTAQLNIMGGTPFTDAMGSTYYEVSVNSTADEDFLPNYTLLFEDLQGGETYAFFIRDANGCVTSTTVPIGIGVDINAEAVVEYGCEGIFPNSTTAIVPRNSASLSDILIALDVDDISIAGTERMWADLPPGEHTAYLYHPNGCTTFVEFTIDAYEPLSVEVTKTAADEVTAVATGGFGDYEYFFQGESQGSDNIFNIIFDATINVRVVDAQGCYVEVVFPFNFEGMPEFPNFFTPDGDGLNDDWFPRNREFFPNIDVIIYDRYGRVVARLDQVKKWNGDYEGKPLPTGDYWYVVNANDNEKQQFVGHFTLYR